MAFFDDYIKKASSWIDDISVFGDNKQQEVECAVDVPKEEVQDVRLYRFLLSQRERFNWL